MATYRAIAAACEAVVQHLRSNYRPEQFGQIELDFKVYVAPDFSSPMQAGVSLFLYRLFVNGAQRSPPGRLLSGGRAKTQLPLDLHFLLTVWARDASTQGAIAGWMMRTLEDAPTFTAAQLNATWPDVFRPEEALEIVAGELSTQDLLSMWDRLSERGLSLSVPYVGRVVLIESQTQPPAARPVGQKPGPDAPPSPATGDTHG